MKDSVKKQDYDFSQYSALIVEDHEFTRTMVHEQLNKLRFKEIIEATDGADGLEKLNETIDIVICDIEMKPVDGFGFMEGLRAAADPINKIPVLFLTGHSDAELVKRAIACGVGGYLLKPLSVDKLKAKILSLVKPK